jgi:hypothetical protein
MTGAGIRVHCTSVVDPDPKKIFSDPQHYTVHTAIHQSITQEQGLEYTVHTAINSGTSGAGIRVHKAINQSITHEQGLEYTVPVHKAINQ